MNLGLQGKRALVTGSSAGIGAAIRFQQDYNGKQPGDPAKAAAAIIRIAGHEHPPLRLLLGSNAFTCQKGFGREMARTVYLYGFFSGSNQIARG